MSKPVQRQPAYLEIADDLRGQIERSELRAGDRLPTERELVEHYSVARMTVRHALDILQLEGLIDRRRGRTGGTFVRVVPPVVELTRIEGVLPQLRERGQDVSSAVLAAEETVADATVAQALDLAQGTRVYHIVRLRRVENIPLLIGNTYLPAADFPGLLERDLSQSLHELLAGYDRRPVRKEETIMPGIATALEQKRLEVSRNLPLLRISRTAQDAAGAIVEYSEDTLRSDVARILVVTTE